MSRSFTISDSNPFGDGFSGAISLPLLPDLIQIYTVSLANGALTIRQGDGEGTIWFERGEIVHAICGDAIGEEAVFRLLEWHNGQFSLDPDARATTRSITATWQNVLMEGCRRLDESGLAAAATVPPATVDAALSEIASQLGGFRAVALFEADGSLIGQRTRPNGPNLATIGDDLVTMLRFAPPALQDSFWTAGAQMHFVAPLPNGRVLHLVVEGTAVALPLLRRAVERVAERLS